VLRHPGLCPSPVEADAFRPAVPERLDRAHHQMQDPGLVVLPGQEHREDEQASEGGQLLAEWIIAASGAARHRRYPRPTRNLPGSM
jgi:hypothetical protein